MRDKNYWWCSKHGLDTRTPLDHRLHEEYCRHFPNEDKFERFKKELLQELDNARNTGIRPINNKELAAWNYVVDWFDHFVKNWPFEKDRK